MILASGARGREFDSRNTPGINYYNFSPYTSQKVPIWSLTIETMKKLKKTNGKHTFLFQFGFI